MPPNAPKQMLKKTNISKKSVFYASMQAANSLKNTAFLKQVACLFKNVSATVVAIWRKDLFQGINSCIKQSCRVTESVIPTTMPFC